MKDGLDKFCKYISINGPDFNNIDEDTLFNLMSESKKSEKNLHK